MSAVALAILAAAGWWSVRLARADQAFRTRTSAGVSQAIELLPRADYLTFQAVQREYDGGDPRPVLERAAAASPRWSAPRIQLGLEQESRGGFAAAESTLQEAARIDHQYEPAWTLANFYFRRGDAEKFWTWIRKALQVSYGDRRLAFDLCWQMTNDPREVLRRAIPGQHEVVAAYLSYLLYVRPGANAVEGLGPVAAKLGTWQDPHDTTLLLAACDALIAAHRIEEAAEVWVASGQPRPSGVTHPDFGPPRGGQGFDWRWPEVAGVTQAPAEAAHRIVFDGQEPESCDLLQQTVKLRPGKYWLRWEARTQGFAQSTGLEWTAGVFKAVVPAAPEWTPGQAAFTVETDWADLALHYRRPAGEPRAEGWVELRHVSIVAITP